VLNLVIIGGGRKDLRDAKDVPQNMTALGGYIKLSERSLQTFQKRRSGGGQGGKKSGGEKKKKDYEDLVYFTMAMSCDVVPTEILSGITVEWMRAGGVGLYHKEIQAFNTHSPFVILKLCTSVSVHTLMAEFKRVLEEAMKLLEEEATSEDEVLVMVLPPFAFRKSMPRLPGLDPADYAGLTTKQAATRKAWHIEMETQHVPMFARLIEKGKEFTLFEDFWGAHVLIS
jgi:hypothetical protein